MVTDADRTGGGADPADHRVTLRAIAHDIRNLAYRLELLSQNLGEEMPASQDRQDAVELLNDTRGRLALIAARLGALASESD
jgi:hypothetical protein